MYQAENLMKYGKSSAWVAKTAGNEFVEILLSHGEKNENYMCHVECIQLYNLNTLKYKLSYQRARGELLELHTSSSSSNKILSRRGSASILKTKWETFSATPQLTKCPGDMTEWTLELTEEERLIDIASIRLDVVGNVNMATFYALRVWGAECSKAIPRIISKPTAEEVSESSGTSTASNDMPLAPGAISSAPLLCLPVDIDTNCDDDKAAARKLEVEYNTDMNVNEVDSNENDNDNDNGSYVDDFES